MFGGRANGNPLGYGVGSCAVVWRAKWCAAGAMWRCARCKVWDTLATGVRKRGSLWLGGSAALSHPEPRTKQLHEAHHSLGPGPL
jgi:hypothetical protein